MIINVPLNIPDELWANALAKDYEDKVVKSLTEEVRKCIADHDHLSYYSRDKNAQRGMADWVSIKIDNVIKEYKSEIIEAAADKLAERLARTKAAKEILEDNHRFEKAYDYQPLTDYNNMMKEQNK